MNEITNTQPKFSVAIKSDVYQKLINETLGDKEVARQFVADISTVVANNKDLQDCEAGTILSAGLTAQSLKLPLSPSLGFCHIVPYKNKKTGIKKATFQVSAKGFTQLSMRSGSFERIGCKVVHQKELQGLDEFGDEIIKFDHKYDNDPIVGYYAYFKLTNGFKKTLYWTKEQCETHANKYSSAHKYHKGDDNDFWREETFDLMAQKTVLKLLLSKYAPMSVELQTAVIRDQAVINGDKVEYVDNQPQQLEEKKTTINNTLFED